MDWFKGNENKRHPVFLSRFHGKIQGFLAIFASTNAMLLHQLPADLGAPNHHPRPPNTPGLKIFFAKSSNQKQNCLGYVLAFGYPIPGQNIVVQIESTLPQSNALTHICLFPIKLVIHIPDQPPMRSDPTSPMKIPVQKVIDRIDRRLDHFLDRFRPLPSSIANLANTLQQQISKKDVQLVGTNQPFFLTVLVCKKILY